MKNDRERVLYDVANLAYVVADIREGELSTHALHQTFDILAPGNIDRVNEILDLASAQVEVLLHRHGFKPHASLSPPRRSLVSRWVHEYLVARVLHDWLSITLPEAAPVWKEKAAEAYAALSAAIQGSSTLVRRVPPI